MVHMTGPLSVADDGSAYVDAGTGVGFGSSAPDSAQVHAASFAFPVRGAIGAAQPLVASNPIRVMRKVEVYQWVEHEEQDAHSTDYVYRTTWLEADVPSAEFKMRGHDNPTSRNGALSQTRAAFGAFRPSHNLPLRLRPSRLRP